jgi:hypothetical protein
LVGKSEGKRPFGSSRRRGGNNIRLDLRDIGWKVVAWMHLAEDMEQWRSLVKTASGSIKGGELLK